MMQCGLARRERGACVRIFSRAIAIVLVLGIASLCAGGSARAEAHPVRVRHAVAAHQTHVSHKGGSASRISRSRPNVGRAKNSRINGRGVRNTSAQRRSAESTVRSAHGKGRHHREPSQEDAREAPPLHRVSSRRRHDAGSDRSSAQQMASTGSSEDAGPSARPANAADSKPLTVNDFLHAASAPPAVVAGIYSSGESHPDEDVSLAASAIGRPAVTARVEAAPLGGVPSALKRAAPSDLVGAPLDSQEHAARSTESRDEPSASGLRAPSRQELTEQVEQPVVLLGHYRNGRLISPPPLKGTREILVHQNVMADDEGLERVQDDEDLRRMRRTHQLVDFPESASLRVNPDLGGNRRCARPWAVHFASDVARSYYARFHQPLQVNSAVRTVAYQVRLRRVNGNAAGIDGDVASPHLTGEALDFGKHGMSAQQIAWMRMYLLPLMQSGKLDVEEEFQQACFHISVYRTYSPASRHAIGRNEVAQLREPHVSRVAQHADQDQ